MGFTAQTNARVMASYLTYQCGTDASTNTYSGIPSRIRPTPWHSCRAGSQPIPSWSCPQKVAAQTRTPLRRVCRRTQKLIDVRIGRAVRWRSLVPKAKMSHPPETPAGGSAGLADGGSGHADTINSCPTRPAADTDFRDHAVRLRNQRGRHCLRRCCDG